MQTQAIEQTRRESKLKGLLLVQILGLGAAAVLYLCMSTGAYSLPGKSAVWQILVAATVITLIVASFSNPGCQIVAATWSVAQGMVTAKSERQAATYKWCILKLGFVLRCFALIDIVGVARCIKLTGGSEGSAFVPFLLIIPSIIILVSICHWFEILLWGIGSIFAFYAAFWTSTGFQVLSQSWHQSLLVSATAVSTLFPLLYYNVQGSQCPKCGNDVACLTK